MALHSEQARIALERLTHELVPYRRSVAVRRLMRRLRQPPEAVR